MALYRCAACGSPNVILDTVNGGIDYNLAKGAIGTVLLGAGGAAAGITSVSTTVFKCPDCGMTLNHAMPDLIKAQIELALVDINGRRCGNQMDWDVLKLQYKNLETRFVDQVYAHTQSEAAFQLKKTYTVTEAEFDAAFDTIARCNKEYEDKIRGRDIIPELSTEELNDILLECGIDPDDDSGCMDEETEAKWNKVHEIIGEDKILEESIRNGRFESPPISRSTYQAWYGAIIVVVENCHHFIPPSAYNSKYTYKNHETYLSSYFSFYVSLALYKSTGKHFIDCTLTELRDFVAQSPFLSSFAQAYRLDEGVYGFDLVFSYAPLLTKGLPTFKICDEKFGYWAGSWGLDSGGGFCLSSSIGQWVSACFERKEAYFSEYPPKKAEYTKLYENCITRKNAYIFAAQHAKLLHKELEMLNAQVNSNKEDINRLKKVILFKAKSIQKIEVLQQENNNLTQDILKAKQKCDQVEAETSAFRADFRNIEDDYDDESKFESKCQSEFERYIAAKMDYYIIWKWSDD